MYASEILDADGLDEVTTAHAVIVPHPGALVNSA